MTVDHPTENPTDFGTLISRISARRRQDACGATRRHIAEIMDNSLTAVMVHRDGRLLHANQAYADLKATPRRRTPSHATSLGAACIPRTGVVRSRIAANRMRCAAVALPVPFAAPLMAGVVWVECMASRIDWDGAPALLATYHDVTARKQTEDALERSERLFATVFQNSPD